MKKKHFNIPIFIPEAACPFQCLYCNQSKISGQLQIPGQSEIINTIEEYLSTMPSRMQKFNWHILEAILLDWILKNKKTI